MANLVELQKEQLNINAELRANQDAINDEDSSVDDIQRGLNRNAALNIRLQAVQKKIRQEQAEQAEEARRQQESELRTLQAALEKYNAGELLNGLKGAVAAIEKLQGLQMNVIQLQGALNPGQVPAGAITHQRLLGALRNAIAPGEWGYRE